VSISEEHRLVAGGFTERVVGTRDWDAPAPVDGWVARDVVRHLVTWLPGFLHSSGLPGLPGGPSVEADPVGAWRAHTDGVQSLLDGPDAGIVFEHVHIGRMRLDEAVNMIYTPDVFMHTWDLARATGQDDRLDPERCAAMLAGMEQMEDVIRTSGQYGARVEVPDDADVQDRLIGFIGRDPQWRAPAIT
jgi:uncharacterized protein (TIGR03086 family)